MQQQIVEYVLSALGVIFTGISGVAVKELVRYLKEKKKLNFAAIAVKNVEETFSKLDGPDKFAQAFSSFIEDCSNAKIKITESQAKKLLQSAVNDLRGQTKQALSEPVQAPETAKEAVQEVVQEVEKPLTEMTSTDLKKIVTQVVQQHVQASTPQPIVQGQ